jgi:hypothetical protein
MDDYLRRFECVVVMRREGYLLRDVADFFGVSRARARQLQVQAVKAICDGRLSHLLPLNDHERILSTIFL